MTAVITMTLASQEHEEEQCVSSSILQGKRVLTLCMGGMRFRGAEGWSEVAWLLWAAWLALHRLCR